MLKKSARALTSHDSTHAELTIQQWRREEKNQGQDHSPSRRPGYCSQEEVSLTSVYAKPGKEILEADLQNFFLKAGNSLFQITCNDPHHILYNTVHNLFGKSWGHITMHAEQEG